MDNSGAKKVQCIQTLGGKKPTSLLRRANRNSLLKNVSTIKIYNIKWIVLQTYKTRILNKYLVNTFSSLHGTPVRTITCEKPLVKLNESTEKNNVVKLEEFQLSDMNLEAKLAIEIKL
ncbi:hypothetical protein ACTFIU_002006 [Dictyostelium citrinum]